MMSWIGDQGEEERNGRITGVGWACDEMQKARATELGNETRG